MFFVPFLWAVERNVISTGFLINFHRLFVVFGSGEVGRGVVVCAGGFGKLGLAAWELVVGLGRIKGRSSFSKMSEENSGFRNYQGLSRNPRL